MNYEDTLAYLYSQLPLFSRIGAAAYKEDITNTVKLCAAVGNPQDKLKTIHIAGTNGKGSTSHMLAAIFQECGYRTGLYTSPHLKDFRERIKVNGEMISKEFVVQFVAEIRTTSEQIEPSFFELTVAMALQYFVEQKVDIAIIETGLGGRLDSTNIITPELSIITNIGYDHMNILGDTLGKIAFEKAGIIKNNVPVVIGEVIPETIQVFYQKATNSKAHIVLAEDSFDIVSTLVTPKDMSITLRDTNSREVFSYTLDLNGIYQQKNLRTVLTAVKLLGSLGFELPANKIQDALRRVKPLTGLYGRWDVVHEHPTIVLDVAHNADGIRQLGKQIEYYTYNHLHIIFGMVRDKDIGQVLQLLPVNAQYYFTKAQIPRALPEAELLEKATNQGLTGAAFSEVNQALSIAIKNAAENDLVIICGSVFLVGEVDLALHGLQFNTA